MGHQSRRVFVRGCFIASLTSLGGCAFRDQPVTGFSLINESDQSYEVTIEVTSLDGDVLHEETYQLETGWSRLREENAFETQKCDFVIDIDGVVSDEYRFLPSCIDPELPDDYLDIVINPPDIEYFPLKC